jgi:hypothetical protein
MMAKSLGKFSETEKGWENIIEMNQKKVCVETGCCVCPRTGSYVVLST